MRLEVITGEGGDVDLKGAPRGGLIATGRRLREPSRSHQLKGVTLAVSSRLP